MTELLIRVLGQPAPQGSFFARIIGKGREARAIVVADNKHTEPWRRDVHAAADSAKLAASWLQLNEPCSVEVVFFLDRPPSVAKSRRWPAVRPDLDKYVRSTLDALVTAHVLADDSRVVRIVAEKRYATVESPQGARIVVRALTEQLAVI